MRLGSLLFVTLLVACSSDPEAAPDYCSQHCEAISRCGFDAQICLRGCQKSGGYSSNVRRDYVDAIVACERSASCPDTNRCADTAKASITPSAAARAYCAEAIPKMASCHPEVPASTVEQCVESVKIMSEATFKGLMGCLGSPCGDWGACEYPYLTY